MKKSTRQGAIRRKLIAVAVSSCFAVGTAFGNPTGANVVRGAAAIHQVGNLLQITNSPNAVINWRSFSIGASETTRFLQQSSASAVLNRVTGGDPSAILGTLQSNGRVFLINPNGILFGASARIDVGGLIASTLQLSNEDFLAGRMNFLADPALPAAVVNQGRITASAGGQVFLVGAAVDNQGVIAAPNGDIVLAAGNSVRVTESPGGPLQVEIAAPVDRSVNLSETLYGSRGLYGGLVRNSGTLNATSAVREADGRIVLKASHDVTLEETSRIIANGARGGSITVQAETGTLLAEGAIEATGGEEQGGRIELLGDRVALLGAMELDASGKTGGGTVLVGGDYQGDNPDIQNSSRTYVAREVEIRADAGEKGHGGKVVIWADEITRYYGSISARGGGTGGDGGLVEVSGKAHLDFNGLVNTAAPRGKGGTLLLDPTNVEVVAGGTALRTDVDAFADPDQTTCANLGGAVCSQIAPTAINAAAAGSTVILQATNDILFTDAITFTNAGAGLNATAQTGNITVNGAITTANRANTGATGSVTLTAGGAIVVNANITTGNASAADAAGNQQPVSGGITVSAGTGVTGAGFLTTGTATITGVAAAGTDIARTGNISVTAGTAGGSGGIGLSAVNALTVGAAARSGATADTATAGNIALSSREEINNGTASTALSVTLGAASGATTNNQGSIGVTTSTAAGNALLSAAGPLRFSASTIAGNLVATSAATLTVGAALTARGGMALTGADIAGAGALSSTGIAGSNGGNISVAATTGAINLTGTITASAGANAGGAGFNAGTVAVSGTAVTTSAITAAGSAGAANSKGGSGGDVTVTASNGDITVGAISTLAGNTLGTGATGVTVPKGGNVSLTTAGGAGSITATTISTSGATGAYNANAGGNGGNVTLDASAAGTTTGNVAVTTVSAFAGLAASGSGTGPGEGRAGGTVHLTSKGTLSFGAVNTRGTAAVGVNQAGGAGGAVTIDSTTGAAVTYTGGAALGMDTRGANGNGTGIGGLGGAITLTDTLTINNNFVAVANSGTVLPAGGANIQFGDVLSIAGNARSFTATTNSAGNVNVGNIGGAGIANSTGTVILTGRSITAGSINTSGRNNAAGGGVTFTGQATGTTTVNGTITTVGGTNTAAGVGRAGGAVNLIGGIVVVVNGAINTSGSAAFAGSANNGGNAGLVTLNANGATPTVTLGASITANGGAAATAGAAQTGGNGGNIQIQDPSLLTADVVVSSLPGAGAGGGASGNGGTVTFAGVVNSSGANRSLAVNTPNTTTFTAAIGGTLALTSLTTDAGTGATSIAGNVTTTGAQTFNDVVTLAGGGTRTFASTLNDAIAFSSTVNGASNLVVNTTGATTFAADVGATTALTSMTTNAGGATSIGGNVRTTGAQNFNDAVTLTGGGTRTFLSTGNNAIRFNSTVDGGSDLVVNTTGLTAFGGNVGSSTALTSVATNAGAGATSIGGNVTTTGAQTFNDAVVLTGNAILTGGTPIFGSTVTGGGFDLTLDFSGATTLNGASFTGIRNLATGNAGTTNLTGSITTTGTQTYNDAVTLSGATTLASGNTAIAFNGTVDGGQALVVNTTGATTFGGAVGGLTPLTSLTSNAGGTTAVNGGAVTTTGAQNYNDATTLGAATTLRTTAGGTISAAGAVTATAGTLTLDTGTGSATFNNTANDFGTVAVTGGGTVALVDANAVTLGPASMGSLTARALTGNLTLAGNVTASGGGDAIVLVAGANFDNSGAFSLNPGTGRWLVYSTNPASDNRGGLAYNFKHYGLTFAGPYGGPGTGNGFIYSITPTITPALQGTVTKTYDGLIAATLAGGNYRTTGIGEIDGDTVVLSNPATSGIYATAHAGSGIFVTADSASTLTSVSNGAATVYGYQVSATPASGNVGSITPRALTGSATITPVAKTYDGFTAATGSTIAGATSGTVNGDTVALDTSGFALNHSSAHAGATTVAATGNAALGTITSNPAGAQDGSAGNPVAALAGDYVLTLPATVTNQGVASSITAKTVDLAGARAYDSTVNFTAGAFTPTITGTVGGETLTIASGTGAVPVNGVAAGTQALTTGTLALGNGTGLASDYTLSGGTHTGTITPAGLSIAANDASRGQGAPNPPFTATYGGFQAGDTPASLTGTLSFSTPGTTMSPAGSYAITPSGQSSTNYAITYVDGTLTVSAAPLSPSPAAFVNPLIPAVNYWVPDPQVNAPSAPVALAMDESLAPLPATAAGRASGSEPAVAALGAPVALAIDENLTPLPPTVAAPVGGSQAAVTAAGAPVALAMDENLGGGAQPAQSGALPSRGPLDDWRCLRYGANLKCR